MSEKIAFQERGGTFSKVNVLKNILKTNTFGNCLQKHMNYILRNLASTQKYKSIKEKIKNKIYPVEISGLVPVAKTELIGALYNEERIPICVITYNEMQAKKLEKNLKYFINQVEYFPKREISIYDYDAESNNIEYERIQVLNNIYKGKTKIVITTIEAIMQKMIAKESLYSNVLKLNLEDTISHEEIKRNLIQIGYKKVNLIENRGEFSVRGDIVDIGLSDNEGVRIEFWGDDIDSIRKFKISSQRSTDMLKTVEIYPATEMILEDNIQNVCKRIEILDNYSFEDLEIIQNGDYTTRIDKYFNEFYKKQVNFLDYIPNFTIFLDEPEKIMQRVESIQNENKNLMKALIEKEKSVPESLSNLNDYTLDIKKSVNLYERDTLKNDFNTKEINLVKGDIKDLKERINAYVKDNKIVVVLAGDKDNTTKVLKALNNVNEIFEDSKSKFTSQNSQSTKEEKNNNISLNNFKGNQVVLADSLDNINLKQGEAVICEGALTSGFEDKDTNLIVLSSDEFFYKNVKRKKVSDTFKSGEKIVFADLKVGDYIVHKNYGIGIFTGVNTIKVDGVTKDFIQLKYRDGDILYVPTEDLDNVRKYIGAEGNLQLNKLGSKDWEKTKAKVKGNLRAVAKELIELYAKRENAKGFAFSKDNVFQKQFEDSFEYTETNDQLRCIEEVKKDMENPRPMDRLLCGDVGYGKTEVAIRAAFKAVMDSKQVAYLAPTTILASQQYQEFKKRMEEYPIRIELLNRFKTQKQQKDIVERLKQGKIDIVLGTHRILSKDVEFKDLGLLIIDEEHRFGVKDKEKIKQYKSTIDVLTMTATPIPRTLQMSVVGIRDMSVIYEPPQNRKPIQTYVLEYDKEVIKEAITKELERKGQVFYIYNIVESIARKAQEIEKLVPEAKVSYAHGKMTGSEIEDIMQDFIDGNTNVLVCTTILESGIDIPNANTIIVENADRFGLAQLYQIRGRVGRSDRQAYAYITYKREKMLSEDATQRLKAIKEFTEFGSGFKIATRDLQIRGAGSIFGEMQHGHIEQIGYDMYNKLLSEVVKEMKGEKTEEEEEITIDLNISSYIPEEYIEDSSQKIEVYQDIAGAKTEEDVQNIIDEIIDRYGEMPEEVYNLLEIARIKNLCKKTNVTKLQQKQNDVVIYFKTLSDEALRDIILKYKTRVRFSPGEKPYVTLIIEKDVVKELKEFLNDVIEK